MRGLRFMAAGLAITAVIATQMPVRAASTESTVTYSKTDFTQVTPENAILYATLQSTSARQARLLGVAGGSLSTAAIPLLQTVLGQVLGSGTNLLGSGTTSITGGTLQQTGTLLSGALGKIFNGEVGVTLLPITLTAGTGTPLPTPHLHLLFDVGLQPEINQSTLLFAIQALGLTTGGQSSYKGFSLISLDLNVLARSLGRITQNSTTATGTMIPANGPISSTFYATVLGNDLVVGSDLPSLQAAVDTFKHLQPSISTSDAFAEATGLLPSDRFASIYLHLGGSSLGQLLQSLGAAFSILPAALNDSGSGIAVGLTIESHAVLLSTSTPPSLQATVLAIPGL